MEKSDQKKLDQNKKRESLQKEKNQIFRQLPRVDELMKKADNNMYDCKVRHHSIRARRRV